MKLILGSGDSAIVERPFFSPHSGFLSRRKAIQGAEVHLPEWGEERALLKTQRQHRNGGLKTEVCNGSL